MLFIVSGGTRAQTKIAYDGFISTGLEYQYEDKLTRIIKQGKIEYQIYRENDIKGELDLRTTSSGERIVLKGAYIRLRDSQLTRLKIGHIKKRFGLEEMVNKSELFTVRSSIVNRHLEYFGYVVRGQGVEVSRQYTGKGMPYAYNAGMFYNEDMNAYLLGRFIWFGWAPLDQIGFSGICRATTQKMEKGYTAFNVDCVIQFGGLTAEQELFYGDDPVETDFRELAGRPGYARFFGTRTLVRYNRSVDWGMVKELEPLGMFCFLAPETRHFDVHRIQALAGINIYLESKVRFRLNGDLILSNNPVTKDEYYLTNSRVSCEMQMLW